MNYWLLSDIGFPRLGGARESPARGPPDPRPNYASNAVLFYPRSRGANGPPRNTLINTARELSYKLSAGRTCKRRESDEGVTLFHPPPRENASLEREMNGNEIACCVPNSFSH